MKIWMLTLACLCGMSFAYAQVGLHQDSFGSREAYCAYLADGHWVDGRVLCIVILFQAVVTMGALVWWNARDRSAR
jgi:hypothetical protein